LEIAIQLPLVLPVVDLKIRNTQTDEVLVVSDLALHLLEQHGYFPYSAQPSRNMEPERLVSFFGIKPGVDYKPRFKTVDVWEASYSLDGFREQVATAGHKRVFEDKASGFSVWTLQQQAQQPGASPAEYGFLWSEPQDASRGQQQLLSYQGAQLIRQPAGRWEECSVQKRTVLDMGPEQLQDGLWPAELRSRQPAKQQGQPQLSNAKSGFSDLKHALPAQQGNASADSKQPATQSKPESADAVVRWLAQRGVQQQEAGRWSKAVKELMERTDAFEEV
jgi:hypothetical protein